ncbi:MAG: putative lipid II flippase FtsW [Bdellovibrionia bacterium]
MVLAMVVFGLIMVYSSSFIFAQEKTGNGFAFIQKQLIFAVLGFTALGVAARTDYHLWSKRAYPVLTFAALLLILVFIPGIGHKVGGAHRWIRLGNWRFQPGELAKFAVIFFVARQLDLNLGLLKSQWRKVLIHFLLPLPLFFLLFFQPDFGTTVIISIVIFFMFFAAGVRFRYLLGALIPGLMAGLWLALGSEYRRARLMTYLDPWRDPGGKGFQILQSFVGLHNGGLFGVGLGNGREKLFYLPEAHNDFIFSVIGEELGFIGVFVLVLAYFYFMYRGLKIAWIAQRKHQDRFGMFLATGITLALSFQGFVNIAVVLGLLPTKGLALPFISYGGSALVVDLFAVGVLLNVGRGYGGQHQSRA